MANKADGVDKRKPQYWVIKTTEGGPGYTDHWEDFVAEHVVAVGWDNCEDAAQVHQLIGDLAGQLEVPDAAKPAAYQELISELVRTSQTERPTQKSVGADACLALCSV